MKKVTLLLLLLFCHSGINAVTLYDNRGNGRMFTVIEYNDDKGVPLVKVCIGNNIYTFLYDTCAGISCVSDRLVNNESLSYSQSGHTMMGLTDNLYIAVIPVMKLGEIDFHEERAAIMSADNSILKALGADGIIGASSINRFVITIDSRAKRIIMATKAEDNGQEWLPFELWNNCPLISVDIKDKYNDWHTVKALFDSGNGTAAVGIPVVQEYEKYIDQGIIVNAEQGVGAVGMMVDGEARYSSIYRGNMTGISIADATFGKVPVITGGIGHLLLCWKITCLGELTLDYLTRQFCFIPYDDGEVWQVESPPVMTGTNEGQVRVAAVWGQSARSVLSPGDIIVSIDKVELTGLEDAPNIDKLITEYGNRESAVTIRSVDGTVKKLSASIFLP